MTDPRDTLKDPQARADADAAAEAVDTVDAAEVEILRDELAKVQTELEQLRQDTDAFKDRFLRARADLDNFRRRMEGDLERAREAGLDSAVLTVLNVFDDLERALAMADENDPGKILPGIRAVKETLERNLDTLGIQRVGAVGEVFDPDLHEALGTMPTDDDSKIGTIAEVYQAGFKRGDRLVRPARVIVYQR